QHGRHWQLILPLFNTAPNVRSNGFEHSGPLRSEQRRVSDGAFVHDFKKRIGRRQPPHLLNLDDVDVYKPNGRKRTLRFLRIAESEKRRTRWYRHIEIAVLLDSIDHDAEPNSPIGSLPHRKGDPAAWPQHAIRIRERSLRPREVEHSEIQDDGIEARRGK